MREIAPTLLKQKACVLDAHQIASQSKSRHCFCFHARCRRPTFWSFSFTDVNDKGSGMEEIRLATARLRRTVRKSCDSFNETLSLLLFQTESFIFPMKLIESETLNHRLMRGWIIRCRNFFKLTRVRKLQKSPRPRPQALWTETLTRISDY